MLTATDQNRKNHVDLTQHHIDTQAICDGGSITFYDFSDFYPHMPIGKVWIYRSLFVCLFVL